MPTCFVTSCNNSAAVECAKHLDNAGPCLNIIMLQDKWIGEVVELSWQPRAFLFKKFLTDEECEHIINKVCISCTCMHLPSVCRHPD